VFLDKHAVGIYRDIYIARPSIPRPDALPKDFWMLEMGEVGKSVVVGHGHDKFHQSGTE